MNMLNENIEKLQYIYKVYTSVCVCITEMEQFFNNTLYDLQSELTKFRFKFIENVAVCGQYMHCRSHWMYVQAIN